MTYLLSCDPGETTGIALGEYSINQPYNVIETWEVEGGLQGFISSWNYDFYTNYIGHSAVVVCERFKLNMGNEFAANLEPLRIEGALVALLGREPVWQYRDEKVGFTDAQMKAHGLWQTDSKGHAHDGIRHALVSLRNKNHLPTLRKFFS